MQIRRLVALLLLFLCANLLVAQRDSLELELGGESVEVSAFAPPQQQILARQQWFSLFQRMDSINNVSPIYFAPIPDPHITPYRDLPSLSLVEDLIELKRFRQHEVFRDANALALIDSVSIKARQRRGLEYRRIKFPYLPDDPPPDSAQLACFEEQQQEWRDHLAFYTEHAYPVVRRNLWTYDSNDTYIPLLIGQSRHESDEDFLNPMYLRNSSWTIVPFEEETPEIQGAITLQTALTAYRLLEQTGQFLVFNAEGIPSSRGWFEKLMAIPTEAADERRLFRTYYHVEKISAPDGSVVLDTIAIVHRRDPFSTEAPLQSLNQDDLALTLDMRKSLLTNVLAKELTKEGLALMGEFQVNLKAVQEKYRTIHPQLNEQFRKTKSSMANDLRAFCQATLAELRMAQDKLKTFEERIATVLRAAEQEPNNQRLVELAAVSSDMATTFPPGGPPTNDTLVKLAHQMHNLLYREVWIWNDAFLEQVRAHHQLSDD